ncbi:hypothetical protein [Synechococcus sp. H60.4]|uniref:hypothetical protein n=1 Tax=unclassified Synechococcus TaxID=2626047 RepID=UPI0039C1F601
MPPPHGLKTCGLLCSRPPFPHATQAGPVRQGIPRSPPFGFFSPAEGSLGQDGWESQALIPSDPQALDRQAKIRKHVFIILCDPR